MKAKDMVGFKVGKLTVIERDAHRADKNNKAQVAYWLCQCDCGSKVSIAGTTLRNGTSKSCGCGKNGDAFTTHGHTRNNNRSAIYIVWQNMIARCTNPNNEAYYRYGGRGITVCDEWRNFENFLADMGYPSQGMTLDRIDSNKNYTLDNCKWSSRLEQANNRNPRNTFKVRGIYV